MTMSSSVYAKISIGIFYFVVPLTGIVASRMKRNKKGTDANTEMMLANRSIGVVVGVLTITGWSKLGYFFKAKILHFKPKATWIGGSLVFGTIAQVFLGGLLSSYFPLTYSVALMVGGLFFAYPLRKGNYSTLIEPFTVKYGRKMCSLLLLTILPTAILFSTSGGIEA